MPDGTVARDKTPSPHEFFDSLPRHIADSLTYDQRSAIARALSAYGYRPPPVNIRLSVPVFGWRCYLAILAGKERRSRTRRLADRERHPLHTTGNFLFILAGAMTFYVMVLLAFLLNASVLKY